ncbi:hypothetical protein G7Y89_g15140 [Cudoniella acicularis]|uniref:Retrovirus-related Pol polyprotein from transposon TNT 1-94-like beta-barrel domain-containing protein n=1 Tax=Cudoniella acicularis TaxID=354080 RepID=A0A8H4VR45_9HELO|nr:hypothetical protein G7Y89_g15140 [Cudoniella acicularis]
MGEIGEHYRDVKRKRSRRSRRSRKERRRNSQAENAAKSASPPSPTRCWDWMIVSGDCYYARDRSSFKTYRSVRGTTSSLLKDTTSRIAGVGTVELEVRRSRNREDTHTLVLKNVLHIPKAICNGVCSQMACDVQEFGGEAQAYDRKNGGGLEPTWYGHSEIDISKIVRGVKKGMKRHRSEFEAGHSEIDVNEVVRNVKKVKKQRRSEFETGHPEIDADEIVRDGKKGRKRPQS